MAATTWPWRLGVVVATAVLTGALVVGDSVRGSLRDLAVGRWEASTTCWWSTVSSAWRWWTN
ncbi:MAG: hypothetical protein R3C10_00080 [Pirellulales bacterium]